MRACCAGVTKNPWRRRQAVGGQGRVSAKAGVLVAFALVASARLLLGAVPPPPLQSGDGQLFVACEDAAQAPLRGAVLRFAENVRTHFAETFTPIGSRESPLSIVLGSATNAVTTVQRRRVATADGFSQLVLRVPNPETVDLEALRTAIVEAQLRERARALGGAYTALTLPEWFVQGAVDASRGNEWQASAGARVLQLQEAGALPGVGAFFAPGAKIEPEVAAFFARWVFTLRREEAKARSAGGDVRAETARRLEALIVTPWEREAVVGQATDEAWEAWVSELEGLVFAPGVLTSAQFARWSARVVRPADGAEARQLAEFLTRSAIGKPQPFRDVTELYLRACAAKTTGEREAFEGLWQEAELARKMLEAHLSRKGVLEAEPVPAGEAQRKRRR